MAVASQNDGRKWINAGVAIVSILFAYVVQVFVAQLGEWFELESKIPNFVFIVQGLSILLGLTTFMIIIKRNDTANFLKEVFAELIKVVWPNRSETSRHTIGIMIGVTLAGLALGIIDFISSWALNLLN